MILRLRPCMPFGIKTTDLIIRCLYEGNKIDPVDLSIKCDKIPDFPEEPTTCCMSGCANCVWLDYAEKLSTYFNDGGEKAMKEIEERVTDPNIKSFLMHELRVKKKS